jgi:hypothetical protein
LYIDNEYNKYPSKVAKCKEKSDLIKRSVSEIFELTREIEHTDNQSAIKMLWKKGNEYIKILKDSILNDTTDIQLAEQVFGILNFKKLNNSYIIKENFAVIKNKFLLSENLIIEHIKNTINQEDFHFNKLGVCVISHNCDKPIKLGQEYKAEICLTSSDDQIIYPLIINSLDNKFDQKKMEDILIKEIIRDGKNLVLKSNNQLNDTIKYDGNKYIYQSRPKRKGTFKFNGELIIKNPSTNEFIQLPFMSEYVV